MAFKDFIPKFKSNSYIPSFFVSSTGGFTNFLKEQFKGDVPQVEVKFPKDLGEEHPFDYALSEGLYKEFGPVTGIIDKYIDYVVGPGFFIEAEDERAKQIIEDFMRDVNFDTLLRAWLKEALIKGIGYLEIAGKKDEVPTDMKVLNASWMYIQRDEKGKIKKYNQFIGKFGDFKLDKITPFEPWEIAQLSINKVGDSEYGIGIVYPAATAINALIGDGKEMHTLLHRKANAPIHVKMGKPDGTMLPTPEDVDNFGKKLEFMNNKHEWATDALVEMKVLDFGKVSEQFQWVLEHDLDMMFFTFQVPEVLMGRSVNLATAPVQMDAWERRVQSIQAETEKIIENQIFKRVLQANGLDVHVEFSWGQKSDIKKMERLDRVTNLLKLDNISFEFAKMLEIDAARQLDFKESDLETLDEEREREEEEKIQPPVPGSNQQHFHSDIEEQTYEGELIF